MMVVTHQVAGITLRADSDILIPHLLKDPLERFRTGDSGPDMRCRIRQFDPDSLALPPLDSQERERIMRTVGFPQQWLDKSILRSAEIRARLQASLDQPESTHVDLRWNRAIIRDFAHGELDLLYSPAGRGYFAGPLIAAGYRNLVAPFWPGFSAVMIHGAGVIRNGAAIVFLAPDEGGKTSVVERLTVESILNDDHVILRQEGDSVMVHGTPFGTITGGPRQARLGGLFLLEKGSCFELLPSRARDVLKFLWDEHTHVWYVLPRSLRIRAFEILSTACQQAITYRMRFPLHYVDWDAIDAALAK